MSLPVLYTPDEVADHLRISRRQVLGLVRRGVLKAVKIGREVRVPEEHLASLLAGTVPQQATSRAANPPKTKQSRKRALQPIDDQSIALAKIREWKRQSPTPSQSR